jgi:D-lactate dehydrogenase (cytochrome)
MSAAVCSFPTLKGAVDTAIATLQCGIPVARMELLDEVQMAACISYSKLEGYAATPHLFFEFHGTEASTREQAELVEGIARDNGGAGFQWAQDAAQRNQLWQARHNAYYAALKLQKGSRSFTTDVCVPISRLDEALLGAKADIEASGLTAPICGHVGDGNFHACILVDPNDQAAMERAWALDKRIVHRALDLGGTCSGEHGIGMGKAEFLEIEHGAEALAVMRGIKQTLDPKGILNPGKMFRN